MNEKQIDVLLDRMKESGVAPMAKQSQDAICAWLHAGIRRNRRRTHAMFAAFAAIVCVMCGTRLFKKSASYGYETRLANLSYALELFPETGVAILDGEIITFEHQDGQTGEKLLSLSLYRLDGKDSVNFDVVVSDNDYILLKEGPVTGEILVDRCSDDETVVVVDLEFNRPNGEKRKVKDTLIVNPTCAPTVIGSAPKDCRVEFTIDSMRKG